MKAPILDPSFRWIPASSHTDSTAFRERQQARMKAAQAAQPTNVKPIRKGKTA